MQWLRSSSDKYHSDSDFKKISGQWQIQVTRKPGQYPPTTMSWQVSKSVPSISILSSRPVLIPCSMMSHHIHSVPRGIFIPSDFPHILVGILQQLGETRQKRSSPIMTQCRPASRNATGLLQHRDRVRVALRHKKFLFSSCLGRNIFVLFRSWKNFQSPKYVFYRYCLCYNIVKHRILAEYAFT